jgi:hypothetical protein
LADEFDAARIALTFPMAIQKGTGFEIMEKGFAWFYMQKIPGRKGRVERRDVLAIRVANEDEKQMLIASDPDKFFTDDHYRGFPAILVNLPAIEEDELTELLLEGWRLRAPTTILKQFDAGTR